MADNEHMTFTKNKSTREGREFWAHVETVAERVRRSPELHNHKTAATSDQPKSVNSKSEGNEQQGRPE